MGGSVWTRAAEWTSMDAVLGCQLSHHTSDAESYMHLSGAKT